MHISCRIDGIDAGQFEKPGQAFHRYQLPMTDLRTVREGLQELGYACLIFDGHVYGFTSITAPEPKQKPRLRGAGKWSEEAKQRARGNPGPRSEETKQRLRAAQAIAQSQRREREREEQETRNVERGVATLAGQRSDVAERERKNGPSGGSPDGPKSKRKIHVNSPAGPEISK